MLRGGSAPAHRPRPLPRRRAAVPAGRDRARRGPPVAARGAEDPPPEPLAAAPLVGPNNKHNDDKNGNNTDNSNNDKTHINDNSSNNNSNHVPDDNTNTINNTTNTNNKGHAAVVQRRDRDLHHRAGPAGEGPLQAPAGRLPGADAGQGGLLQRPDPHLRDQRQGVPDLLRAALQGDARGLRRRRG